MVKRLLNLFVMGLVFLPVFVKAQSISAFVDRNQILLNDVLTLTIRVDAQLGNARPNLSALEQDFVQLSSSISNQISIVNGARQSWTEYVVALRPRTTGTFTIPAIRINGESSRPITVFVGEPQQSSSTSNQDIFLEVSLSKQEIYVQEQLVYKVKIFYAVNFDQGAQLTSPQVENSVVQQVGDDVSYETLIQGIRYQVTERTFVIFPQASGSLNIPPIYFSATIGGTGLTRFFNRSNRRVREINLVSDGFTVDVLPKPASFPADATWLPASAFRLEENWSGDSAQMLVGDSITRNLVMRATGLSSSLLPGLEGMAIDGLKFYPDQPSREDSADAKGVSGSKSEAVAIVPSRAGTYIIPETRIPWWNTQENRLETAVLPERSIEVIAAASQADGSGTPALPLTQVPGTAVLNPGSAANGSAAASPNVWWISSTALFAAAWLFTLLLYLRSRQQFVYANAYEAGPAVSHTDKSLPDRETSFKYLRSACEEGDLMAIKKSLISWAQSYYQDGKIKSLNQLKLRFDNADFSRLLNSLEEALYGDKQAAFSGDRLLKKVKSIQKQKPASGSKAAKDYSLPPLYKN